MATSEPLHPGHGHRSCAWATEKFPTNGTSVARVAAPAAGVVTALTSIQAVAAAEAANAAHVFVSVAGGATVISGQPNRSLKASVCTLRPRGVKTNAIDGLPDLEAVTGAVTGPAADAASGDGDTLGCGTMAWHVKVEAANDNSGNVTPGPSRS